MPFRKKPSDSRAIWRTRPRKRRRMSVQQRRSRGAAVRLTVRRGALEEPGVGSEIEAANMANKSDLCTGELDAIFLVCVL